MPLSSSLNLFFNCFMIFLTYVNSVSFSFCPDKIYDKLLGRDYLLPNYENLREQGDYSSNILMLNTIDGNVHAILLHCNMRAKYLWSINLDKSQFKHNFDKFQLYNETNYINIIPSLNGELYLFDGIKLSKIDIPYEKDRFNITSSQSTDLYIVNLLTGKIMSKCLSGICNHQSSGQDIDSTIVIRHKVTSFTYLTNNSYQYDLHFTVGDLEVELSNIDKIRNFKLSNDFIHMDNLNLHLSEGIVTILDDNSVATFQKSFNAPIVNGWLVSQNSLKKIELFSNSINPSTSVFNNSDTLFKFIGTYKSRLFLKDGEYSTKDEKDIIFNEDFHSNFYLFIQSVKPSISPLGNNSKSKNSPSEKGFYIGYSLSKNEQNKSVFYPILGPEVGLKVKHPKVTLIDFWKEVLLICFVCSVIFHMSICRLRRPRPSIDIQLVNNENQLSDQEITEVNKSDNIAQANNNLDRSSPIQAKETDTNNSCATIPEYTSRFFGEFKYLSFLGRGSFGSVYKSQHLIDMKKYAIKQINLSNINYVENKILREVQVLAKLEHPNIVRYYQSWEEKPPKDWYRAKAREIFSERGVDSISSEDLEAIFYPSSRILCSVDMHFSSLNAKNDNDENIKKSQVNESDGALKFQDTKTNENDIGFIEQNNNFRMLYIQVELCAKRSLDSWLVMTPSELARHSNNPLGSRSKLEMLKIFRQLADAIKYVHSQGLMHRDLKPANVFFNEDNKLKLGDFGLVAFSSQKIELVNNWGSVAFSDEDCTLGIGTLLYMSPEMLEGRYYSQKVDVYALGLILFEMLNNFTTFHEKIDKISKMRKGKVDEDFASNNRSEYSLIKKMLLPNAKKRLSSIKVIEHLDACISSIE